MTQLVLAVNVPSTTPMTTGRETRQALPPGVWLGEQSYFAWSVKQSALEKKTGTGSWIMGRGSDVTTMQRL